MKRYIDADLLKGMFQSLGFDDWNQGAYEHMADLIDEFPSADVREVKRGRWIEHKDYPGLAYLCSECNLFITDRSYYCPRCGADMREEEGA